MQYCKKLPLVNYEDFLIAVKGVRKFQSMPEMKRYEVDGVCDNTLSFSRLDASGKPDSMNLYKLYQAYIELPSFNKTIYLKPYINGRHSPDRGLLLHLKMISF